MKELKNLFNNALVGAESVDVRAKKDTKIEIVSIINKQR